MADDHELVPTDDGRGNSIIVASWAITLAYTVTAVVATATGSFVAPVVVVTVAAFVAGLVVFVVAYLIAVGRSRHDRIGMGGLFFLAGATAPKRVRRHLMGSFAAQVLVASVTASIGVARFPADATNPLAFGFLTSLFGLSLAGLWGARFGSFAPRPPEPARRSGSRAARAAQTRGDERGSEPADDEEGDPTG